MDISIHSGLQIGIDISDTIPDQTIYELFDNTNLTDNSILG